MKSLFLFFALALPAAAAAGPDEAARAAAALAAAEPRGAENLFSRDFFAQVPLAELNALFSGLYSERGAVTAVLLASSGPLSGHYFYDTAGGWRVPAAVSLEPRGGKIKGLFLGTPYRKSAGLKAARDALAALPGRAGLLARRLGEAPETLEALNEDEDLEVAGAADLYVLGALLKGGKPWRRVFKRPAGAPLTARALAGQMLSGDRAAADTLITGLGRRRIEALLPALGHAAPERLRPFLKNSEALALRADTAAALEYLNLPPAEKYGFLEKLPAGAAGAPGSPLGRGKLGWRASPADLCRLLDYVRAGADEGALALLAQGAGRPAAAGFAYAGGKNAAGPGALAGAWLLRDGEGRWACLAAVWNDGAGAPDPGGFYGALNGALAALASAD